MRLRIGAFVGGRIGPVIDRVVVRPGDRCTVRIERRAHPAHDVRTVIVVLHVLLAREHELHRHARHRHRRLHGVVEIIPLLRKPASEAAAHRQEMIRHLLEGKLRRLRAIGARAEPVLRARPDFERSVSVERRRIHRLHRRMREIGNLIDRFVGTPARLLDGFRAESDLHVPLEIAAQRRDAPRLDGCR